MANLQDLTARELEILQLVVDGKTNKEIANEVFICKRTVEFHLYNIYTKLGIRTRMRAGLWALQQGVRTETSVNPS